MSFGEEEDDDDSEEEEEERGGKFMITMEEVLSLKL